MGEWSGVDGLITDMPGPLKACHLSHVSSDSTPLRVCPTLHPRLPHPHIRKGFKTTLQPVVGLSDTFTQPKHPLECRPCLPAAPAPSSLLALWLCHLSPLAYMPSCTILPPATLSKPAHTVPDWGVDVCMYLPVPAASNKPSPPLRVLPHTFPTVVVLLS